MLSLSPSNSPRKRLHTSPQSAGMSRGGGGRHSMSTRRLLVMIATVVPSFFLGTVITLYANVNIQNLHEEKERELLDAQSALVKRLVEKQLEERGCLEPSSKERDSLIARKASKNTSPSSSALLDKKKVGNFIGGIALTPKSEFTDMLDLGVPLTKSIDGADHTLMFYSPKTLPDKLKKRQSTKGQSNNEIPTLTMTEAVQNCEQLNIILTDPNKGRDQCTAIVPQYESYTIQKWMRVDQEAGTMNKTIPLQLVSRGMKEKGRSVFAIPTPSEVRQMWDILQQYITSLDDVLKELGAILEKIADENNTVIVMVCNFGQSELLMNFACSAKARGLNISNIIVFTTDQETTDLAESIGLTTYYDKRNFGDTTSEAARTYGDKHFKAMMMAKVISVQLVSMLGYDLLFQDVDIVWFKNPLDYFRDPSKAGYNHDIVFQDDGGHSTRFAPYAANSGFYFARNNARTQHFFSALLMSGDLIVRSGSHQQALIAVLNEEMSMFGLRVKVLSRDTVEFPCGFHFNQRSGAFMKSFFAGEVEPFIFHQSWTLNKNNKLLYLRQMGEWFVKDVCVAKTKAEITNDESSSSLVSTCCAAEPLFSCHYRDKPSKYPCKDSPPIDKGGHSFWN